MTNKVKMLIGVLVAGTLGAVGLAHIANASKSRLPVAMVGQNRISSPKAVSDGDGEINDDVEKKQETNRLQSLRKITPQQARTIALSKVNGNVHQVELDNEDGHVIYTIKIDKREVKIDAGNGQVLSIKNFSGIK